MKRDLDKGFDPFLFAANEADTSKELSHYVPFFKGRHNVLDVGCGRGLFLDLLREQEIGCVGLDHDPVGTKLTKQKGHQVIQGDIFDFFGKAGKAEFDGMLMSHIVEHLEGIDVLTLLKLSWERLAPGGRLIIVTPNTRNSKVLQTTFWLDLDHKRPYPQMLLEKLLENLGATITYSGNSHGERNRFWKRLRSQPSLTARETVKFWLLNGLRADFLLGDTFVVADKPTASG